ncbi:MAG: hypothetical protein NC200_04305 [Candidatus Gastranaerophilales bacterium]|nr:hypothetical protein [Candidatus Gastranaerophilales bacterium]
MVSSANYNLAIGQGLPSQVKASTSVKFGEKKEKTEAPIVVENAKIKFHKVKQSDKYIVTGEWSEDYIVKVKTDASKDVEKHMTELMSRYKLITFKAPEPKINQYLKHCYKLDSIIAPQRYSGAGTKAMQALLERSLADKDTEGRIVLYAEMIDEQTSPAGFFYKLGFRFVDKSMNEIMEKWVAKKILTDAPKLSGMMYLPKNHINKLMTYSDKKYL